MLDGQSILLVGSLQLLHLAFQIDYFLQALFVVVANQKAFNMLPII
jgi:hypothetical protein